MSYGGWSSDRRHKSHTAIRIPLPGVKHARNNSLAGLSRHYASNASPTPNVAILGGGITGLATALYLTEKLPDAQVTIYEGKETLGGWLKSRPIDVGDGEVIFEAGPRSLRPQSPNGHLTLDLAHRLGLYRDMLFVDRNAPAAKNRFIYYPDRLVKMPGPGQSALSILQTLATEPIFDGTISTGLLEFFKDERPETLTDQSVGDFISRRFSARLANNLLSALYHGIYAGDIWKLSARSILPVQWNGEARYGSFLNGAFNMWLTESRYTFCDDLLAEIRQMHGTQQWPLEMAQKVKTCSVFTFRRGVGMLAEALERKLYANSNVSVQKSTNVQLLSGVPESSDIKVQTLSRDTDQSSLDPKEKLHTHVISTISPDILHSISAPHSQSRTESDNRRLNLSYSTLRGTHAVTVAVVNLYFRTPELLKRCKPPRTAARNLVTGGGIQGFGYLIPQTVPLSQNPERALGVIFDSDITPDLYSTVPAKQLGTRLTVMLGGHYWDDWASYPTEEEAIALARQVLERHLGIDEAPTAAVATLQPKCIPQYYVGFEDRMAQAGEAISEMWNGRLRVAGSWYTGVGVNDCIRGAYDVATGLAEDVLGNGVVNTKAPKTGLERFQHGRPMALVKRTSMQGARGMAVVDIDPKGRQLGYADAFMKVAEQTEARSKE
ncbi:MAG: oxygen-dependent protoporphyrinogen oxidase [Chrysothrix sp. TS-e1954]|nr:MAG: oxygen-dependent protoporphyrinogen oxidase [Chrysothrix sp. TS-e1954]